MYRDRIKSPRYIAALLPAVVCTVSGLLQRAMPKEKLLQAAFEIRDGSSLPPEDAEDALLRCGYLRTAQVEGPGQFSRRGGILDVFPLQSANPVRLEFFDDEIESIREFDVDTQVSFRKVEHVNLVLTEAAGVETLRAWSSIPDRKFRLVLEYPTDVRQFLVVFRHDSDPVQASPVKGFPEHRADDWFHVSLKFLEVV